MRVRLLRKLALVMNGVDVSRNSVGDILDVEDLERAQSLIDAEWAEAVRDATTQQLPSQVDVTVEETHQSS